MYIIFKWKRRNDVQMDGYSGWDIRILESKYFEEENLNFKQRNSSGYIKVNLFTLGYRF